MRMSDWSSDVCSSDLELGPAIHHRLQVGIVVDVWCKHVEFEEIAVAVDLALAGFSQNDEFVAVVAADRAGVRLHRDRLQTHPREGAKISDEHPVVGRPEYGRASCRERVCQYV